jgi:hypothetical protein
MGDALQRRDPGTGRLMPVATPKSAAIQSAAAQSGLTRAVGSGLADAAPPLRQPQSGVGTPPVAEPRAKTARLEGILPAALEQEQQRSSPSRPGAASRRRASAEEFFLYPVPVVSQHQGLIACIVTSLALIWALFATPLGQSIGTYTGKLTLSEWVNQALGDPKPAAKALSQPRIAPRSAPIGESSVVGPPTISAAQIDSVLASYGSPAAGSGRDFYNLGVEYGIDPAYALAFFIHESSAGTASGWAGIKADGSSTHNIGNIICAGYSSCYNRFRDYPSWAEGIEDWYKLISTEYINGRSAYTVEQIIPIYAPSFENNVPGYIQSVNSLVSGWRQGQP